MSDINILKRIETEHDQKPAQVMERLNISKSSYSMIKNGKIPVSKKLAIRINKEYHYTLDDILSGEKVQDALTIKPTGTC